MWNVWKNRPVSPMDPLLTKDVSFWVFSGVGICFVVPILVVDLAISVDVSLADHFVDLSGTKLVRECGPV